MHSEKNLRWLYLNLNRNGRKDKQRPSGVFRRKNRWNVTWQSKVQSLPTWRWGHEDEGLETNLPPMLRYILSIAGCWKGASYRGNNRVTAPPPSLTVFKPLSPLDNVSDYGRSPGIMQISLLCTHMTRSTIAAHNSHVFHAKTTNRIWPGL